MVDPISNASGGVRGIGTAKRRTQVSPGTPSGATDHAPGRRVEKLRAAVEKLLRRNLPANSRLQIQHDEETGTFVYRAVDQDTGEVVSQWPSEQMLQLRQYLSELEGVLVDKEV